MDDPGRSDNPGRLGGPGRAAGTARVRARAHGAEVGAARSARDRDDPVA
ncbi:hypothetical protein ACIQRS_06480 [Streptomyces termitum]|nr:hypothetical protein [Streptomyces termitum]